MAISKAWDWDAADSSRWLQPSEDVYYYLDRWTQKGFKKFLDLGCGLGRHSIFFAQNGFDVCSLDLSQSGIDTLKKNAEKLGLKINTTLGDMNSLPYAPESFDCLLAYHVISHTDSIGIKTILNEIGRVLKPGGEFYITLCSKNSSNFTEGKYPKLDENTILKTNEPEMGVPHFYTDLDGVKMLMRDYKIISLRQIQDIYDNESSWHYFIHGRKQ